MAENIIVARRITASGVAQALYLLSVVSALLPFGAVNPIPLAVATILACLAALVSAVVFGLPVKGVWLFATAVILTVLIVVWVEIQTLPALDTGLANPLFHDLGIASLPQIGSISIQPADSIAGLSFLAIPMLAFLTGLTVMRSDTDARRFVVILSLGGAVLALYGLIQFTVFPETNLFFLKTAYLDSLTATFVNRNTAGTFLGLVCLALARYVWSLSRDISLSAVLQRLLANRPVRMAGLWSFLLIAALFGASLIALLLTKSRGAIGSTVVALLFLVCLLVLQQARGQADVLAGRFRGRGLLKAALAGGFLLLALGLFGGRTLLRAEALGTEDSRYCVLPGIIELAKGEPLLGYGFGAFRYAFPPYRDPKCGVLYVWERAHNIFLEGFVSLGAMFALVLVVGVSALMIAQLVGFRHRRRMRSYPALGLASLLLVCLHGLVDFSLQIPGMAAYFAALMAATSTISLGRSTETGRGRH